MAKPRYTAAEARRLLMGSFTGWPETLRLPMRVWRALRRGLWIRFGRMDLADLLTLTPLECQRFPELGPGSIKVLMRALAQYGLALKVDAAWVPQGKRPRGRCVDCGYIGPVRFRGGESREHFRVGTRTLCSGADRVATPVVPETPHW
jgi:hypothetical protein